MNHIHVKPLWDKYGNKEIVVFETGKLKNPIMIINEYVAKEFAEELIDAIEIVLYKVR